MSLGLLQLRHANLAPDVSGRAGAGQAQRQSRIQTPGLMKDVSPSDGRRRAVTVLSRRPGTGRVSVGDGLQGACR